MKDKYKEMEKKVEGETPSNPGAVAGLGKAEKKEEKPTAAAGPKKKADEFKHRDARGPGTSY